MSSSLADFYCGKRVLVTGHTGFQGGWATAWLKLLGAQVCGYGLPPATRPNFFDAAVLDGGMTSIFSDIRDRNSLANTFAEFQPEIILHCASRSNPQFAYREPVEVFSTNVMGTVNVLEEARLTKAVRAVVIVNSEAYDNCAHVEGGYSIRDASMRSAELARSAFLDAFLMKTNAALATASASDAIGGGDWGEGRIIPNLVRSLTSGEPVTVNNGSELPVWHVLDLVHAYLLLAQKLFEHGQEFSKVWDFGPRETAPATDIAKEFVSLWDAAEMQPEQEEPLHDLPVSNLRNNGRAELGWAQVLPPTCALRWTVDWYRAFYADSSFLRHTTEAQIEHYMKFQPVSAAV